jgi:hypothetical protein
LSGVAGLLLDQRDGPVRTVQLIVYVGVFIAVVRFVRLVVEVADTGEPSKIDHRAPVETGHG